MILSPDIVGTTFDPVVSSWDSRDCALYALGVGAGQHDPTTELQFTTDNTRSHPQVVIPTFAVVAGCAAGIPALIEVMRPHADLAAMLHGEQLVEQLVPLPTAATVETTPRISAAWDKGRATVLESVAEIRDAASGVLYARTTQSLFFRGVGGWGGARGPASAAATRPERAPDEKLRGSTRPDQALLYRLSGDTNPLHSDPAFARRAGFERPILHGLCTYGAVGRMLLERYADADPSRFVSLAGRMSKPIVPGGELTVLTWEQGGTIDFIVLDGDDETTIDNGLLRLTT